ncbi:hypothetical protein [Actinacidiphila sp. bgisy167]|uniref:hypothetical protein n=1 Tax=Actinacidiphila sp. bgisy167 TaxID=3413797 RepID=UPI003D7321CC
MATRLTDDDFPGWVEVTLTDAHDRAWTIIDKCPIFGGPDHGPDTTYPVEVTVDCRVLAPFTDLTAGGVVKVSTDPHSVAAVDGTDEFDVRTDDLLSTPR